MHRVQQAIRVALYAVTLAVFVDAALGDPRLPLMCKNIARDVIMNSCKGSRIKRAPVALDQVKLAEELKIDTSEDHKDVAPQKRQWGFENVPFGGYNGAMESNYHDTELRLPGVEFSDDRGSQWSENQFLPGLPSFPGEPDPFPGPFGLDDGFRAGSEPVARSAVMMDSTSGFTRPPRLPLEPRGTGGAVPGDRRADASKLERFE